MSLLPPYAVIDGRERLSVFFTVAEAFRSSTATLKGIVNYPADHIGYDKVVEAARGWAVNFGDPVRMHFGAPLLVSCWYRSPELNALVGGVPSSQHLTGEAVDFNVQGLTVREVFQWLVASPINFDQVIDELRGDATWIHGSHATNNRREALLFRDGKYLHAVKT
jgi:hypothetical protein